MLSTSLIQLEYASKHRKSSFSYCAYSASGSLLLISKSLALVSGSLEDRGFHCSPSRWSIRASIHGGVGRPLQLSLPLRRLFPSLLLLVYSRIPGHCDLPCDCCCPRRSPRLRHRCTPP